MIRNPDPPLLRTVSVAELGAVLRTRVGLVLGPGAIFHSGIMGELSAHLSDAFNTRIQDSYLATGDVALSNGASEEQLRVEMATFIQRQTPDQHAEHLARVKWTGVLSACIDEVFDQAFSHESAGRQLWQPITIVSDLRNALPPRTIPVYKLLGSLIHDDAACCSADLYRRSAQWPNVCRALVDRLQGAPIVCIGMSASPWVFWQLLGVFAAEPATCPSALVFLDEDPLARDPTVHRLASGRLKLYSVAAELRVLLSAVTSAESRSIQELLPFPAVGSDDLRVTLHPFRELAVLVNSQTESTLGAHEIHQLHELLFEPSRPKWDAFVHNLDFARDVTKDALSDIELLAKSTTSGSAACVIHGLTACGKTTVLKRLALDLARGGHVVLWLRPWFYQDTQAALSDLFRKVRSGLPDGVRRIIVCMDDPLTFGTLTAQDVVRAAEAAGIEIILISSARAVDWQTRDERDFIGRLQKMSDIEVPHELSPGELARLPAYLVRLGVVADIEAARQTVGAVPATKTQDVLATLYWSLPETRVAIKRSIRDEYFRLGDSAALTKVVIGEMQANTGILQEAYALIAVSEKLRSPVPIEVLVASLDVRYDEWLDAAGGDSAAWGLFYADYSEEGETITYRTRNAVVNEIIVRTLNGGELSHAGEFLALKRLLAACKGTAPTYREFCVHVLLSHSLRRCEFQEGVELFDIALSALPHPDRTLVHHKGIWIKDRGQDPVRAARVLTDALTTPNYPYASHGETDEHIYTSLAAASLKSMQMGAIPADEGRRLVLGYLDKAQSRGFFNPNATHVEARLIQELVDRSRPDDPDRVALLTRALRSLDRSLSLLRVTGSVPLMKLGVADDITMLESARDNLLSRVLSAEEMQSEAEALWTATGRQDGFVLVARMLFAQAQASEKGTTYHAAFDFCERIFRKLSDAGVPPLRGFVEAAVDIYYQWRVARRVKTGAGEKVEWNRLKGLSSEVLRGTPSGGDPFHEYVHAISLAHLGDWAQADALFAALRRSGLPGPVLWTRRDCYLAEDGRPLRVQGVVREIGDRRYLYVEGLKTDLRVERNDLWPKAGEIAHAYVEFSFGGPTAVRA
jgi:hypothetical protein